MRKAWTRVLGSSTGPVLNAALPSGATVGRVTLAFGQGVVEAEDYFYVLIGSPPPGGGAYQTLTVACTVPQNETLLYPSLEFLASCVVYIDNANLPVSAVAVDYVPVLPALDLTACQRFFERHGGANKMPVLSGYAGAAGQDLEWPMTFCTQKGGQSGLTVTKLGTWTCTNAAATDPLVSRPSEFGYSLSCTSQAAGVVTVYPNSSDDIIDAVWSPP